MWLQAAQASACGLLIAASLSAAALPEGAAKPLIETACTSCHSLDRVTAKVRTRQEWRESVANMMERGARLNGVRLNADQAQSIVGYLTLHYGKRDRARDLYEDSCSSCHSLARVSDYALTKEEWYEETKGMISEGTVLTDEELDLLLNYLARNFGPKENSK